MFAGVPEQVGREARFAAGDERRLAHQLRALGQGSQAPVWDQLSRLELPVALITGRADQKYDAIADQMFERVGAGTRLRLPGGHSLPLEAPRELADALVELAHTITE
jgi:pimeloyl-ACP methyl ester carboxylesterase